MRDRGVRQYQRVSMERLLGPEDASHNARERTEAKKEEIQGKVERGQCLSLRFQGLKT